MRSELAGRSLPLGRSFIPRNEYAPVASFPSAVSFRKAYYEEKNRTGTCTDNSLLPIKPGGKNDRPTTSLTARRWGNMLNITIPRIDPIKEKHG